MSKKVFILLLVLMSVSLIGIIFIQSFFILKNYTENNNQFASNVKYVLDETASIVERTEFRRYVVKFRDLQEMQNKIIDLSKNKKKRITYGKSARDYVIKNYDENIILNKIYSEIENMY